jgi:transcriptional regulator with XRE-family HTH domain
MQEQRTTRAGRPKGAKTFESGPALAFGLAVRARRLEIQLSQEALAHAAQVERSHLGKIERGEHMPNLVLIFRLASALAIAPGELVDRAAKLMQDG